MLSRGFWAGSQRYGAAMWSGDIFSKFSELAVQIKVAQGVALSGVDKWTTDIGGYKGGNPEDPTWRELIVRWFQFGVSVISLDLACAVGHVAGDEKVVGAAWRPVPERCISAAGALWAPRDGR